MTAPGSEPTRLLYLLPDYAVGGGQVILQRTVEALTGPDRRQIVAGFAGGPMLPAYQRAGIDGRVLGSGRIAGWPLAWLRLVRLIRAEGVEVLVSLNTPLDRTMAQLAALVTGRPVVIWFGSLAVRRIPFPPPASRVLAFAKRLVLYPFNWCSVRLVRLRLTTSAAVAASFAEHLGLGQDDFIVVPPGLPDRGFDHRADDETAAAIRAGLGLGDDHPVLVNVGMLIPLKGQRHLIEMMELLADDLPRAHLLLVGEGPDRTVLEERIAASPVGDRIHLLGRRDDVDDLLSLADGLLSASRSEGFGMNVLEAMAASLPVVAVRTPAFLEFLDEGSAVLVDSPDAAQLAAAVSQVFDRPGRAETMGRHGRELAEAYRMDRRAKRFGALLSAVAGAGGGGGGSRASILRRAVRALRRRRGRDRGTVVVRSGPGRGLELDRANTSADYEDPPEGPVQEALVDALAPGSVFYDVGANVGFFSLLAGRLVAPAGRVVAFEPVAANAEVLQANAARNGLGNIEVRRVAVGAGAGSRQLYLARHPGGATLAPDALPPDLRGSIVVDVVTIDDVVASGGCPPPDVVKVDVEGAELDVLEGMADTLRRDRPVVVLEVDAPSQDEAEASGDELSRHLAVAGYRVERLEAGYPGSDWAVIHLLARPVTEAGPPTTVSAG